MLERCNYDFPCLFKNKVIFPLLVASKFTSQKISQSLCFSKTLSNSDLIIWKGNNCVLDKDSPVVLQKEDCVKSQQSWMLRTPHVSSHLNLGVNWGSIYYEGKPYMIILSIIMKESFNIDLLSISILRSLWIESLEPGKWVSGFWLTHKIKEIVILVGKL